MKNKKRNRIMLLLVLLLGITVGFAALATTLKINGNASITKNTWSVHWDDTPANIHVTEGSVSADTPTVGKEEDEDPEKSLLSWSATLDKPGDFYEFTADVVNDGSIDGMISEIVSKVNGEVIPNDPSEPSPLPKYAKYSVTYGDGEKIEEDHLIAANSRETYKIRIEYTDDINPSDLDNIPPAGKRLAFTFRLAYAQATEDAKDRKAKPTCPGPDCVYAVPTEIWTYGENGTVLQPSQYYTDYEDVIEEYDSPLFTAMILDEGRIDRAFVCEKVNNEVYCLEAVRNENNGGTTENTLKVQEENVKKLEEYDSKAIVGTEDYKEFGVSADRQEASIYYRTISDGATHSLMSTTRAQDVQTGEELTNSMMLYGRDLRASSDPDIAGHGGAGLDCKCYAYYNGMLVCQYAHE